jgi:succinyl-CoA synthetase alpha subunit
VSIIIDGSTRVLVQGITGAQGRFDTRYCLDYGTKIVAGVTPGRGGAEVAGVPVFNTVARAVRETGANASVLYVPAAGVCEAVLEAVDAGIQVILATAENVPRHDAARAVSAARAARVRMVGFNTNGLISPGKCKLGAIGGDKAAEIFRPGRVGVVSRSGGMSPEISSALSSVGLGISTCISMGGDPLTGMRMAEYLRLFEEDDETDLVVLFGEPGTANEREVADALAAGEIRKPVVALIAGSFQEAYPSGVSFGHVAAMITGEVDTASAKRALLARAGATVVGSLEELADAASALAKRELAGSSAAG